jgi:hypothetical protein
VDSSSLFFLYQNITRPIQIDLFILRTAHWWRMPIL